jgi:hypothetical protein
MRCTYETVFRKWFICEMLGFWGMFIIYIIYIIWMILQNHFLQKYQHSFSRLYSELLKNTFCFIVLLLLLLFKSWFKIATFVYWL